MTNELIRLESVSKHFPIKKTLGRVTETLKAVDDVSFTIKKGETLGLVGESGSGKTTLGRTILQLEHATGGKIFFDGIDITNLNAKDKREIQQRMQIIFQDPYASLNPKRTAIEQVIEPLSLHYDKQEAHQRALEMLNKVGIEGDAIHKYPREFSGGQRQRIGIARAVVMNPDFILCDEPISALDVSIQAQIINLLVELQASLGLTYLFISHDLSMVRYISDRIAVMYLGKLVELGPTDKLFEQPQHAYTKKLLSAIPVADPALASQAFNQTSPALSNTNISNEGYWTEVSPEHFVLKEDI
ncbi:ABC transporter ATP-binding protein [Vagococcus xieshaowenii]|uniref:ABC transporter ATP-binding protein n=1 Tax=Vagococcus xieshaowenii TaxID=2562451 RepID=A0AAJ5JQJ2_9ENTE|nr:ATP-binding cassette domain-containing protein [Vagococcus xieshaowenii]QCA28001.1 ABC transporter ATP-binding protein [Vagococcus xieshaowenii]TFZ41232.1 ABC transporter ATP-binding protein [Vagococcus xieshaowenii]